MSWSKIKTILIILFLFTDIFLASSILISRRKETQISPEVIDATVQILGQHNISVDKSIIPAKIPTTPVLQADNVVFDYEGFAKLLLGDGFRRDDEHTFFKNNAMLTFSGDKFSLNMLETRGISASYAQSDAQKSAFSYLKSFGFDVSDAKVVSVSKSDGVYKLKIRDFYENMPVFSSETDISVYDGGIISLSGSWFNKRDGAVPDSTLKSIASVLSDFAVNYTGDTPAEIIDTELGYSIFDSENYHKSASLIPVNKIILKGGQEYILDSRTAQ